MLVHLEESPVLQCRPAMSIAPPLHDRNLVFIRADDSKLRTRTAISRPCFRASVPQQDGTDEPFQNTFISCRKPCPFGKLRDSAVAAVLRTHLLNQNTEKSFGSEVDDAKLWLAATSTFVRFAYVLKLARPQAICCNESMSKNRNVPLFRVSNHHTADGSASPCIESK